jgi:hypothetical protein
MFLQNLTYCLHFHALFYHNAHLLLSAFTFLFYVCQIDMKWVKESISHNQVFIQTDSLF